MAAPSKLGRTSLITFICGAGVFLLPFFSKLSQTLENIWGDICVLLIAIYIVIYNVILLFVYRTKNTSNAVSLYQVAMRGGFLGVVFGVGLLLSISNTSWTHFGWYACCLSFFHWSEYFVTAVTNPRSLTLDSYMLDHSKQYKIAAAASWVEFAVEWLIFSPMKQLWWISVVGLCLVIGGEVLRKASMFTASTNFNHYVQSVKLSDHTLVTRGVYGLFRHPAYVGWFYWSIGTQIILCNPLCLVVYTYASWKFFHERIYEEEIYLLNFFGEDYLDYQKHVRTGLPFIKGYKGEL